MLCSDIDLKNITHSVVHVCCCSKERRKKQKTKSNLLGCGIQHNVFTCANSNILVTPRKHTHLCFYKQPKTDQIHDGWLKRHRERICWIAAKPWTPFFFSSAPSAWCSWPAAPPVDGKSTSSSSWWQNLFKSVHVDDRVDETCDTHPEHSATELDGHGEREGQLEFRDVDRQAGLRREENKRDNGGIRMRVEISEEKCVTRVQLVRQIGCSCELSCSLLLISLAGRFWNGESLW